MKYYVARRSLWTLFPILALLSVTIWPQVATSAQLTLTWLDNSTNEAGFKIERKIGTTGGFAQIATTGADATSYVDPNLSSGMTYCYRTLAFNTAGTSAPSNEACGTTTTSNLTLTVTRAGSGTGTVTSSPGGITCGADCSEAYTNGAVVTLTATPASGSTFAGWSDGGCSGTGTCTVTTNTNVTVTATFSTTTSDPPIPGNDPSDPPTPDNDTPPGEVVLGINAGGSQYIDLNGIGYVSDVLFTGGATYKTPATIAQTADDSLYRSGRYGKFSYAVPVANGDYVVTLKFAEIYFSAAGKRIFDVVVEGKEVISNLDIFLEAGKNVAYDIDIPVAVTDGVLNLSFHPDVNNAQVNAILVTR